jgi:hypothetical protein
LRRHDEHGAGSAGGQGRCRAAEEALLEAAEPVASGDKEGGRVSVGGMERRFTRQSFSDVLDDRGRRLHGEPIDRVACALLDMQQPSRSRFLRLVGPPGTGTSQSGRAIAYRLWTQRGRAVETRRVEPFHGFAEMSRGPSSDEFTLRYPSRPRGPSRSPRLRVADVGRLEVHGRKQ